MRYVNALWIALSTYSRLPVPRADWSKESMRYSMCFFPLVGLFAGGLTALWLWLGAALTLGDFLKGAVCACLPLALTGGIHMDGFLDTTDALASWQPREKRLEILKDSHAGAFAVIGGCAYLLLYAGVYAETGLADAPILGMGFVLSRALSGLAMALFRGAREDGMLHTFAQSADKRRLAACMGVYLALCGAAVLWLDWRRGLAGLVACAVCFAAYRHRSYQYFGGVTGDLAGHFLQRCELAYACCVVLAGKNFLNIIFGG